MAITETLLQVPGILTVFNAYKILLTDHDA